MQKPLKSKIGIIRGLMPRVGQAEFALSFEKFNPVFITAEAGSEIKHFCKTNKLKWYDLKLKKIYGIDPIGIFTGRITHQSWVAPDKLKLLEVCKGLDVLETYELYHFFSAMAADVAKQLQIPLVVEVWTSFIHPAYFVPPYSFNVRKVINAASLFIARSEKAKSALLKLGVDAEKIKVIYHGVNIHKFKSKYKFKKKNATVLYVGEMEKYKGVDDILEIWPQIRKKYPDTELWLVGKGSLVEKAKKVRGVRVYGYVPYDKLPGIYRHADIFVSPSKNRYLGPFLWWEEFFSYTLMEAQAAGLPIISTYSGGIPEEVGSKNLLIDQADSNELKNSLIKLIESSDLRNILCSINRKRAENMFDIKKLSGILENELLKILPKN